MTEYRAKHGIHIGGLVAVGFAGPDRFLLVVTHSGRGVFNLGTGEGVARAYTMLYAESGEIAGIGPLDGERVSVAEYDCENNLVVASGSGRYRVVGESSFLSVEEAF